QVLRRRLGAQVPQARAQRNRRAQPQDRKSTRLNSSHDQSSYAGFCLKKKKFRKGTTPSRSRPGQRRILRSDGRSRPAAACFFFNDTATTEIYTLSLHDALPI